MLPNLSALECNIDAPGKRRKLTRFQEIIYEFVRDADHIAEAALDYRKTNVYRQRESMAEYGMDNMASFIDELETEEFWQEGKTLDDLAHRLGVTLSDKSIEELTPDTLQTTLNVVYGEVLEQEDIRRAVKEKEDAINDEYMRSVL